MRRTAHRRPRVLYHFTSEIHLERILESGHLDLTESNIEISGAGPRVVWLTETPTAAGNGLSMGFKDAVRFTIPTPMDAQWWPEWSRVMGIEEFWYEALASASGGDPDNWWVVARPIDIRSAIKIEVRGKEISKSGSYFYE